MFPRLFCIMFKHFCLCPAETRTYPKSLSFLAFKLWLKHFLMFNCLFVSVGAQSVNSAHFDLSLGFVRGIQGAESCKHATLGLNGSGTNQPFHSQLQVTATIYQLHFDIDTESKASTCWAEIDLNSLWRRVDVIIQWLPPWLFLFIYTKPVM